MTFFCKRFLLAVLLIWLAGAGIAAAQSLPTGPQVLTFYSDVDDTEQPYALYLPRGFDEAREYPLVISLHGAGSNHRLNLRRVFGRSNVEDETDVEASRYFPEWEDREYIVASPLARGTMGYQGVAEKDVLDVLADVKRRFPIDDDRVYLTGLSMGGGGTLWLGLTRPDIWAAIAPVCPAPPEQTTLYAPNALHLPVHFFQGGADPVVPAEGVRAWADNLEELGTSVEYVEYPGVGHDSWVQAYADGHIFDVFDQYRRDRYPDRVRFSTERYEYGEAYWVRIDGLTPGTPANIDARFRAPNAIEVTTHELHGFTLRLANHPQYAPNEPAEITIDGELLDVPAGESLSFNRTNGRWVTGLAERGRLAKKPGLEGPMSEVVAERHVYVFGTQGVSSPEEIDPRRADALAAGTWSVDRGSFLGRVMVFPRIISDREVRPSDLEAGNLVLFGTRETNSVIADLGDSLPMHLNAEGDVYGLAYVYPVGDNNYVLLSSGAPWWEAPGEEEGFRFADQLPAFDLVGRGDYILFNRETGEVMAEGRFDDEWRLPEVDAKEIAASGVVSVEETVMAN